MNDFEKATNKLKAKYYNRCQYKRNIEIIEKDVTRYQDFLIQQLVAMSVLKKIKEDNKDE